MTCTEAIKHAKDEASRLGKPMTVWRGGDNFAVAKEEITALTMHMLFGNYVGPVRPVATYDPDGTEHK